MGTIKLRTPAKVDCDLDQAKLAVAGLRGAFLYSGHVTAASSTDVYRIGVGSSGRFADSLPAGDYRLTGRSPLLDGGRTTYLVPDVRLVVAGSHDFASFDFKCVFALDDLHGRKLPPT